MQSSSSSSSGQVRVRFVTEYTEYRISDAPFAIPAKLGRSGLSEVINHLLGYEGQACKSFDFCINDVLVRAPLSRFLSANNISTENIVQIEYMPASTLSDEKQSIDTPAWVGCLDTRTAGRVLAGCFDGSVEVINAVSKRADFKLQAHNDPVRAIVSWTVDPNGTGGGQTVFATASKDQMVKCWLVRGAALDSTAASIAGEKKGGASRKKQAAAAAAEAPGSAGLTVDVFAVLAGHCNSVESVEYWAPRGLLLSGDWAGNLIGWNIDAALASSTSQSAGAGAGADGGSSSKRQKQSSGSASAPSSAAAAASFAAPAPVSPSALFTLKAHTQSITGIQAADKSSARVFTSSWDHAVKEWDIERQDVLSVFTSGSKIITSMHYNEQTSLVGTSHSDGKVRLWDTRQGRSSSSSSEAGAGASASTCQIISNGGASEAAASAPQWVSQMKWHASKSMVFATADYAGWVRVWDIRSTKVPLGKAESHDGKALCVDWAAGAGAGAAAVFSGGSDCMVHAMDFQ